MNFMLAVAQLVLVWHLSEAIVGMRFACPLMIFSSFSTLRRLSSPPPLSLFFFSSFFLMWVSSFIFADYSNILCFIFLSFCLFHFISHKFSLIAKWVISNRRYLTKFSLCLVFIFSSLLLLQLYPKQIFFLSFSVSYILLPSSPSRQRLGCLSHRWFGLLYLLHIHNK